MLRIPHDPRGAEVLPTSWYESSAEHEVGSGVTIPCQGTDLCRFCQAAKRAARRERARLKAATSRAARRTARQAVAAGREPEPHRVRDRVQRWR